MIHSEDLSRIKLSLKLLENLDDKKRVINNFFKFKKITPFSKQLNNFINRKVNYIELINNVKFVYVDNDDFDETNITDTFQRHLKRFKQEGKIHIWKGASDNTIFGESNINHKFRAWHDYIHLINELGYDTIGESIVCDIQQNELPNDWIFERELLHIEIVGQLHYYNIHKNFVDNQREFTIDYLINPKKALLI